MSMMEQAVVDTFAMPKKSEEREYASRDPLSPPALLEKLYDDFSEEGIWGLYPEHLSDLATNPSLPPRVFIALFDRLKEYGVAHTQASSNPNALSYFFVNPLTTFKQVISISQHFNNLNHWVNPLELDKCKTVIELFDTLVISGQAKHRVFFSNLLCSPMVSAEDLMIRVRDRSYKHMLLQMIACSDPRFIPTAIDYSFALASIDSRNPYHSEHARSIIVNPNTDQGVLAQAIYKIMEFKYLKGTVYDNLNCPFELSASYHLDNLETYKWRPSYLLELEAKVEAHLTLISGEGPWEDLPLSWKLKMIAG
jgi:disulfide bond formation protein DsbB